MHEPELVICDIGNRSQSVRTGPIRLSGIGVERTRSSDSEGTVPRRLSRELERSLITIRVVKERLRGMPHVLEEYMFMRERYSLVAAMVTMIIPGLWVFCIVVKSRERNQ